MNSVPLRRRIFMLVTAGVVPVAVMSALALVALFAQQRQQAERAGLEIARALATAVDAELRRSVAVLEVLATTTALDMGDVPAFGERALRTLGTQPFWRRVIVARPDGTPLINTGVEVGTALPPIVEVESFRQVVRLKRPVVGYIARGPREEYMIPIRVPVVRNGELKYVLTAIVTPNAIVEIIRHQKVPQDWTVSVFDGHNMRVARSRAHQEFLGSAAAPSLAELMDGRPEGTGYTQVLEGDSAFTAFVRARETGWSVAISVPPKVVLEGARNSLVAYGSGLLLSIILGVLGALGVARSINRPIGDLRNAAQGIGRGVIPAEPSTPIRELQDVGHALVVAAEQRAHDEAEREMLLKSERAARAYAEAANKSKDEFLAMLGHELRNPLGAISNATAILDNPRSGEDMRQESRTIIARQVEHLRRLTDDLLDAARALTGKIVLERQPVELAALVAQSLRTFESSGRMRNHVLEQDLEPVWIDADRVRVDQILSNLLGNALKYTSAGGTIRVGVRREGNEAVLRVADTGIGMTPELASRAFDLFVQGDRDLDRSLGGLGIGLTLVRRLAEMHGGWAKVQSEGPGLGSEFIVTIPAIEKPVARDGSKPRVTSAKGRDVLVIEDNEDARETLRTLLELAGHRVRAEADGVAGLESALDSKPDVMLIDIGLPKMDGYEVARRVREASDVQRPFLVAVTGYGSPEDRKRAIDAGFDAHLVKPVDFEQLQEVLERAAAPTGTY